MDRNRHRAKPFRSDIAIIGMSCIFPKAPDLASYWQNIVSKVDAISDPPEDWEASLFYDPNSTANDRTYCKRGGYLGDLARFNPFENGVMPNSLDGGEPDHYLALRVAREALSDAGYLSKPFDPERAEVILGRGTYVNRGVTSLVQHGLAVEQTLRILKELHPEYTDADILEIKNRLKASLPPFTAETAPSLVPNVVCGRIANRLNFMGHNYLVDAACASSLIAVQHAMRDLRDGVCDLALAGGVHASTPPLILMIFCQINALSRRSHMRPFDKDADGTMLGEGLGVIALKRREDAERDGDRIYALLKEIGSASDGRALGLLAPRVEGEELAIRRAYEAAGIDPRSVGLIEAHGTATPLGDVTEVQALGRVFGPRVGDRATCGLGTVKSMISHCIPASGIAGIIKAALSLHHKVLPPTLHCEEPNPKLELEKTPFYLNTETRPWIHGAPDAPRRAGVNAFGFGGINAHAILEEYPENGPAQPLMHRTWESEAFVIEGDSRRALCGAVRRIGAYLEKSPAVDLKDLAYTLNRGARAGSHRLGLIAAGPEELRKKLKYASDRLEDPACRQIKERSGIYFFEAPLAPAGKIAFLFPGEGSQYTEMLSDLCIHFPMVRESFDLMDRAFSDREVRPSELIFPPPVPKREGKSQAGGLWQMQAAAQSVFAANQALHALLTSIEIRPDAMLGHSTGEYSALLASGALAFSEEEGLLDLIRGVDEVYRPLVAGDRIPEGVLLAVGGGERGRLDSVIRESDGRLLIAMDNCPHQVVLFGSEGATSAAARALSSAGFICAPLPFNRAYHTPQFKEIYAPLRAFFSRLPFSAPAIPLYSCATAGRYPGDPESMRDLAAVQWIQPVRFRETIEKMYADGIRVFVEAGPNGNITSFVDDTLRSRPSLAVASNLSRRSGISQLNHLIALLSAQHVPMKLDSLYERRAARPLLLDGSAQGLTAPSSSRVSLVLPILKLEGKPQLPKSTPPPAPTHGAAGHKESRSGEAPAVPSKAPVAKGSGPMDEYMKTMGQFLTLQETVMRAHLGRGKSAERLPRAVETAPLTTPAAPPAAPVEAAPPKKNGAPKIEIKKMESAEPLSALRVLSAIAAEKTGYPEAMLGPSLNMEAELGIDSIKRVEILGALRQKLGLKLPPEAMEKASRLKTLQEVADFFDRVAAEGNAGAALPAPRVTPGPLMGKIVSFVPDQEVVVHRKISMEDDLFLKHHTLGGAVSEADAGLTAFPVVPLTMSMEILAEAGALLAPGLTLVGMRNIRTYSWIGLDDGEVSLKITARRRQGTAGCEIETRIQTADAPASGEARPGITILEGTMLFAGSYSAPPAAAPFALRGERASTWSNDALYSGFMFHGPSFQGVSSIDRTGEDGTEATLTALPRNGLFRSNPAPAFLTDPVMLDAAGQVIAYWTGEHLKTAFHIFPYRLEALDLYGPPLSPSRRARCDARVSLFGAAQVRSDIDIIDPEERLLMRLIGWEDLRFDLPEPFFRLRTDPRSAFISRTIDGLTERLLPGAFACAFFAGGDGELLEAHGKIWRRVLGHLMLSRGEREVWRSLQGPDKRQLEWLMGRVVAKDAVRLLLQRQIGRSIYPADIEIGSDTYGRPVVSGPWTGEGTAAPILSLAHSQGAAIAIAGDPAGGALGIDIEGADRHPGGFDDLAPAFSPAERRRFEEWGLGPKSGWAARLWCAKEAVAKALGRGLMGRPQDFVVVDLNAETGTVRISVTGASAGEIPGSAGRPFVAHTIQEGRWIIALSQIEKELKHE